MSRFIDPLLRDLIRNQNPDGGWGYASSTSWTEPSCYAILALQAMNYDNSQSALHGLHWLMQQQREDGGWAPQSVVKQSTWVTSLASLTIARDLNKRLSWARSIQWLEGQVGQPSSGADRLRTWLFGTGATRSNPPGWSWVPGTASWVTPTVMGIIALSKADAISNEGKRRSDDGRNFLLSRRCADGGWNHGGTSFRSESAASYPETTGMALIGLQGMPEVTLRPILHFAQSLLPHSGSSEATSWLQIALATHGRISPTANPYSCRTNYERSLQLLALAAADGRNMFFLGRQ